MELSQGDAIGSKRSGRHALIWSKLAQVRGASSIKGSRRRRRKGGGGNHFSHGNVFDKD